MSDFLPRKAKQVSPEDLAERERQFNQKLKALDQAPIQKVDDFQKTVVKDLPVERINTKEVQKLTSGNDFVEKIAKLRALKQAGKKVMGVLPFAGTIGGLMSGDPAMAAEEAAGDIPVLGQAYEALKPTDTGNVDEERMMIAERNAREAYLKSPAHQARLRALKGFGQ